MGAYHHLVRASKGNLFLFRANVTNYYRDVTALGMATGAYYMPQQLNKTNT